MNPRNIIDILAREFDEQPSEVTSQEEDFARTLIEVIVQANDHGYTYVERVHDLVTEGLEISNPVAVYDPEATDVEYQIDPDHEKFVNSTDIVPLEYKKSVVNYWRNKGGKQRKLSSVKHQFRKLKHEMQLYRWEKQIEAGGTFREKLRTISSYTYEQYLNAKREHKIIHDLNLRRWALHKARELNCSPNFKASNNWLHNFKRAHRIVGRKITKFVSKKDVHDKAKIEESALDFLVDTMPLIEEYGSENVFNADQSGFQYETHGGRTLADKNEKKCSYTIMPMMSASGRLVKPLYMVLQEKDGKFGPQVLEKLFKPSNVIVSCSKSGKMGGFHLDEWLNKLAVQTLTPKGVLVVDSWSTFTLENISKCVPEGVEIRVQQIPPSTTGMIQPWDVFGFRIYKNFVRQISDFIILHDIEVVLSQRNECIKLQSLVYHQLCSPRYIELFKYSWFKSGYVTDRPNSFHNPVSFAFRDHSIVCQLCDDIRMLRCSWCKLNLCFTHFWTHFHLCQEYIE